MKMHIASALLSAALLLGFAALASTPAAEAEGAGGRVNVTFTNVKTDGGELLYELCTEEEYANRPPTGCALRKRSPAATPETDVSFDDVPPGTYALQVFHDADGDGRMKVGQYGEPQEPIGASNDAKGKFGPPAFEEMAFEVKAGERAEMTVTLYTLEF